MFTIDTLEIYKNFLASHHVRLTLLKSLWEDLSPTDLGLRRALFGPKAYQSMRENMLIRLKPGQIGSFRDDFGVQYLSFLCQEGSQHTEYQAGVVGPFVYLRPGQQLAQAAMRLELTQAQQQMVHHTLLRVAYIEDRERWVAANYYLLGQLIGGGSQVEVTHARKDYAVYFADQRPPRSRRQPPLLGGRASDSVTPALLDAVKNADVARAGHMASQYVDYMIGYHRNAGLDVYDVAVGLNTLLLHTALAAGVDAAQLSEVYAGFAERIAAARKSGMTRLPYIGMAAEYCRLIERYRPTHKNPLVIQAMDYLEEHHRENVRLRQVADSLKVSEPYLSSLFHRETGVTLVQYLHQIRVRQARELLENTSLTMGQVAEQVGFADANYFTRVFRQVQGCPPGEYRRRLRLF